MRRQHTWWQRLVAQGGACTAPLGCQDAACEPGRGERRGPTIRKEWTMSRWSVLRYPQRFVGVVLSVVLLLGGPLAQAADLLVSSVGTFEVLRYDGTTGAFLGAFVPAGSGGLANPVYLTFGPSTDATPPCATLGDDPFLG